MANLVITESTNSINVNFGIYTSIFIPLEGTWKKDMVVCIKLTDTQVTVTTEGEPEWQLTFDGALGFQVDSINASSPSSNSDLYNKLIALIA